MAQVLSIDSLCDVVQKPKKDKRILIRDQEGLDLLGRRLKELRISLGLSQEDLAHNADISVSQVSRIENGHINPTVSTIFHIARAMRVPVSDLFQFKLDPL